mmetsp:Transcript_52773/g.77272  ORF Transcript_52773/g.77272 Transcript_52773/m.77272 type:complete len:386 (+) Transcript_52773:73-1230(+)
MCRVFWAVVVVFGCAWLPSSLSFAPTCNAPTFRRSSNRARCVGGSVALRCMAQLPERNVLTMQVKIDNSLRDVYLVGTMHYNPVSLQRVGDTVDALAETNSLSSVVIESCAARYAKWKDASPTSMQRRFLLSEMQVASDRAKVAGVELILGDQSIEDLGARTKVLLKETVVDLASPLQGGWGRCAEDVWKAGTTAFPSTPSSASFSGLGLRDLFDPALMAAAPVSLLRYPLAWLYRSPLPFLTLIFGAVFVSVLPDLLMYAATGSGSGDQGFAISAGMSVAERVDALAQEDPQAVLSAAAGAGGGLLVAVAEIVLFARVFLVALLNERNVILADKIRSACARAEPGKAVVAVLGMAHVNGVAAILDQPQGVGMSQGQSEKAANPV